MIKIFELSAGNPRTDALAFAVKSIYAAKPLSLYLFGILLASLQSIADRRIPRILANELPMNAATRSSRRIYFNKVALAFALYFGALFGSGCALYDGLSGENSSNNPADAANLPDAGEKSDADAPADTDIPDDADDPGDTLKAGDIEEGDIEDDATAPPDPPDWLAVSAGSAHACAIKNDHTVWCWGLNNRGQLGHAPISFLKTATPKQVPDLASIVDISAGTSHTCAVSDAGDIYCWGFNQKHQLGSAPADPEQVVQFTPMAIDDIPFDPVAVSAGASHTCALFKSGEVYCWGATSYGQIGANLVDNGVTAPIPAISGSDQADENLVLSQGSISAGMFHTCARDMNIIRCWGRNHDGELGIGISPPGREIREPELVADIGNTVAVAAGGAHTCAVDIANTIYCWGSNLYGQLAEPSSSLEESKHPVLVAEFNSDVTSIAAGGDHSCAVTQGEVYCWGDNGDGQLGRSSTANVPDISATPTPLSESVKMITAGGHHTCALTTDGEIYCWGRNAEGQLGFGDIGDSVSEPVKVLTPQTP